LLDVVIDQRRHRVGRLEVGRLLPLTPTRAIGPFVFFDHLGPITFQRGLPRDVDARPHPHIGLSALTYLFAGQIVHRDSVGSQQTIQPGEVNWLTAGKGVTHSERFEKARAEGGPLHGFHSWVALPNEQEEIEPSFAHFGRHELAEHEYGGWWNRLLAGEAFGVKGHPEIHSPLFLAHWALTAGTSAQLPANYPERAAYIVSGVVEAGGRRFSSGQMLVFKPRTPAVITASTLATIIIFGGEPVGPRFVDWNFVSSSRARIEQAKADWRAGRMRLPDFDNEDPLALPLELRSAASRALP